MSKGDTFENDLLKLIFNGTAIANLADNAVSAPLTSLYASLHTADPGEGGSQTTSECTYTGYSRVAIPRTTSGWTVTANSVSPASDFSFGVKTGGSDQTATHAMIGAAASGAGKQMYRGPLTPNVLIENGDVVNVTTGSTITED